MKNRVLLRTNILVVIILLAGFMLIAVLSYKANYGASLDAIEEVSYLSSDGLYYQLQSVFAKPVNVSVTMAHDRMLIEYLMRESENLENEEYVSELKEYLKAYKEKYKYDSVFLVSTDSGRYYNFNGVDRIITEGNSENDWYYDFLEKDLEYSLQVDNDEVAGADNQITVFVNCRIKNDEGTLIGIVGVGVRIDYLQELLEYYQDKYNVTAYLIDNTGIIQLSTQYTGFESHDWFETEQQQDRRDMVLSWEKGDEALSYWDEMEEMAGAKNYIVTRYLPDLSWHLITESNTGLVIKEMSQRVYECLAIVVIVIVMIIYIITLLIKNFNKTIVGLMEEKQKAFRQATEQLYDNVYELNITKNCAAEKSTERFFKSLGIEGNTPYDTALEMIAEKQIKEEFREGYIKTFSPENVIRQYEQCNNHLQYDFMVTHDGENYSWMHIDGRIFFSKEDSTIRLFTYRKNIDHEKQLEEQIEMKAQFDEMTGVYTKTAVEYQVTNALRNKKDCIFAFFMIDIDNFKTANDEHGHAFGDDVIKAFVDIIKGHVDENFIVGRIGGDEFAVFMKAEDVQEIRDKAEELSGALDVIYQDNGRYFKLSASIGVAIYKEGMDNFHTLYKNSDYAMYHTKKNGKNGVTFFNDLPQSRVFEK